MPSHTRTIPQNMRNTFSINHQLVAPLIIPNAREKERQKERRYVHAPPSSFKYFERIFFSQIFEEAEVTTRRNGAIPDDSRDDNEPRRHVPHKPIEVSKRGGWRAEGSARIDERRNPLEKRRKRWRGDKDKDEREKEREKKRAAVRWKGVGRRVSLVIRVWDGSLSRRDGRRERERKRNERSERKGRRISKKKKEREEKVEGEEGAIDDCSVARSWRWRGWFSRDPTSPSPKGATFQRTRILAERARDKKPKTIILLTVGSSLRIISADTRLRLWTVKRNTRSSCDAVIRAIFNAVNATTSIKRALNDSDPWKKKKNE